MSLLLLSPLLLSLLSLLLPSQILLLSLSLPSLLLLSLLINRTDRRTTRLLELLRAAKNAEPRESKDESECGLSDGQVHVRQFEGRQRHLQVQDQRVKVPDVSVPGHGWPLDEACLGKALDHGVKTDGDAGDRHVLPR